MKPGDVADIAIHPDEIDLLQLLNGERLLVVVQRSATVTYAALFSQSMDKIFQRTNIRSDTNARADQNDMLAIEYVRGTGAKWTFYADQRIGLILSEGELSGKGRFFVGRRSVGDNLRQTVAVALRREMVVDLSRPVLFLHDRQPKNVLPFWVTTNRKRMPFVSH